jgi:hypothetical protein
MKPITVKCSDCRHYKDRYTLFMHGGFPQLRKLLELNLIDERDFICEGWGCVYHPLEDFAHDEHLQPIFPQDLPSHPCEYFEPKKNRQELAKNIWCESGYIARGKKVKHLDISQIPCGAERLKSNYKAKLVRTASKLKKE